MLLRYLKKGALASMLVVAALVLTNCGSSDYGTTPSAEAVKAVAATAANPPDTSLDIVDNPAEDLEPNTLKVQLTGYSEGFLSGVVLLGGSAGASVSIPVQPNTKYFPANLNVFPPNPVKDAVAAYNASLSPLAEIGSTQAAITQLASLKVSARLRFGGATLQLGAFRPVL